MHMPCSLLLNYNTSLKDIFFRNEINQSEFLLLNITIIVFSIINDIFYNKISKSVLIVYITLFNYVVMMLCMTCNVYILVSYLISKLISYMIRREENISKGCCK